MFRSPIILAQRSAQPHPVDRLPPICAAVCSGFNLLAAAKPTTDPPSVFIKRPAVPRGTFRLSRGRTWRPLLIFVPEWPCRAWRRTDRRQDVITVSRTHSSYRLQTFHAPRRAAPRREDMSVCAAWAVWVGAWLAPTRSHTGSKLSDLWTSILLSSFYPAFDQCRRVEHTHSSSALFP